MHKSAMTRMQWFIENYVPKDKEVKVLDIGSCNVNGCYRPLFSGTKAKYVGLDICSGINVDVVYIIVVVVVIMIIIIVAIKIIITIVIKIIVIVII